MATTPKHRLVADELHAAITQGQTLSVQGSDTVTLTSGARLPTEPELAQHFEVGRSTIRSALAQLAAEGLIETRGRAGTFVRLLKPLSRPLLARWQTRTEEGDTWSAHVLATGRTPSHDFEFKIVPAQNSVAEALQVDTDALVAVREQLRYINDVPWSLATAYYPYDIAREAGVDDPHDIPEGAARRMAKHGYIDHMLTFSLGSRPATPEETSTFDLPSGVSMLVLDRVMWSTERPIRLIREVDPADRNRWTGEIALGGEQ